MVVFLIAFSKVLKMAMYHPDFFTLFNHRYVNHLVEKDYCHGVHEEYEEQPVNLKTCARCQLAQYCSVACQKYDFEDHKNFCKRIKTLTDKVTFG
jgi:radical SAM protein with 4Fe4S-binding SPASM domain